MATKKTPKKGKASKARKKSTKQPKKATKTIGLKVAPEEVSGVAVRSKKPVIKPFKKGDKPELIVMAGMPRSCSTLALNILNQNERFHAESTSGILNLLAFTKVNWQSLEEFRAFVDKSELDRRMKNVLKGMLNNYYDGVGKDSQFLIDKGRGWLAYLEMLEMVLGKKPKVIVPVRGLLDIVASFEKLHQEATASGRSLVEFEQLAGHPDYFLVQTMLGRSQILLSDNGIIGIALNRLNDALNRGWKDHMFFLEAEKLTTQPQKTMDELHEFLGAESFKYNFNNIVQTIFEDDFVYGVELHKIKKKITPLLNTHKGIIPKKTGTQILQVNEHRICW